MANIPNLDSPQWQDVYQIETTDRVQGGPDGISNRQATQLVARTGFLKKKIDDLVSGTLVAEYAARLKTGRTIAMSGDGSWSVSFDGSGNISGVMTLKPSVALTGAPTVPTAALGANTTQIANTAFVQAAIAALVSSAPAALDTLNELAAALGNDPNFATTMTNALAGKLASVLANGDFLRVRTAGGTSGRALGMNTAGQLVIGDIDNIAKFLALQAGGSNVATADPSGMSLLGTPTAPTPAAGSNGTQIANTAFVQAAIAALVSSAPATLDTLNELATALGNDPNFATTMTNALAGKLASVLANGDFLRVKTAGGTSGRALGMNATGQLVIGDVDNIAKFLALQAGGSNVATADSSGMSLLGTPTAPTPAAGSNGTQIANTAFVQAALAGALSASAGSSGYQKLGGGLVLQWGVAALGSGLASIDVTFPVAFTSGVFVAIAVNNNSAYSAASTNITLVGMTIRNTSTASNSGVASWIVIGK